MANPATTPTLIQSLQRGLQVVEAISEKGPLTAKSISESTGIVLPTAYHLLRTLIHEDYLCRLADGRYSLGHQLLNVAQLEGRARSHRLMREVMSELSLAARANILIGVVEAGDIVVWSVVDHPCAPRIECWPGMRLPGHATAIGKSILSRMLPIDREGYLRRHPVHRFTSQTKVTARRLTLDAVTGRLAVSDQEFRYGVSCVAAALDGLQGLAAVGAAYSSDRSTRARAEIHDLLVQATVSISNVLPGAGVSKRPVVA
jgi:IclR family transcriptional regulator, acetate operon repressor